MTTTKETFAMVLKQISFNQKNLGIKKNMMEHSFTASQIATVFSKDKKEIKSAMEELTKLGLMVKEVKSVDTKANTSYDAKRFTTHTYKEANYSLTQKAVEYVSTLKTA